MSLDNEDIDAAVTAGVIAPEQAKALRAFALERRRARIATGGQEDESFRFMTGFNDFFFAVGILLLGSGIAFFTSGGPYATAGGPYTWPRIAAAAIMWALSELLVRRLRLVLPGILLSIFFMAFVYLSVPLDLLPGMQSTVPRFPLINPLYYTMFGLNGVPLVTLVKAVIGATAGGLYYWRFRLPFVLLPIAASLVALVISLVELSVGRLPMSASSLLTLACGIAVFAAAMRYDISDRDRVTRRSDCAFWLHLLAAPLIVHSLVSVISPDMTQFNNIVAIAIILIVAMLAVVAIAIDRRALLVSALLYVGLVIAYAIGGAALWTARSSADKGLVFFATLIILGAFVITLGVGWMPLRRRLIALISPSIAGKLSPVPNAA